MKQLLIICVLCLFLFPSVHAQTETEKPEWVRKSLYLDAENSYVMTIMETGYSKDNTREKAGKQIVENRRKTIGDRVLGAGESEMPGFSYAYKILKEYWECDEYCTGYFLVQICKTYRCDDWETVKIDTDEYPFSARVFIPGMAQIYKGSTTKGICFIAGEAVFVGGIIISESLRISNINKSNSTHNSSLKQNYIDNANTFALVRNISIAGAAITYVWNVIDGSVAKGKKHVVIGEASINMKPYSDFESTGLTLNINF